MTDIGLNEKLGFPTAAALGIFDGVHLGHRRVISAAVEKAAELGCVPAVFTFNTESVTVKGRLETLMTDRQKRAVMERLGIQYILSADFPSLRDMSPERFVKEVLIDCMNVKCVVCGKRFRFGKGGIADSSELVRLCAVYGADAAIAPQLDIGGDRVSSTRIRELIRSGGVARASELMGSHFCFELPVIKGFSRGHTWGFPTINQQLPPRMVKPRFGVYCSKAFVGGEWLPAVTNIGVKPTVEKDSAPLAETYILDYSGDLYGKTIAVELHEFVRPEMKFQNFEELKAEIGRNTCFTRNYFGIDHK